MFWYIVICVLMLYPLAVSHAGTLTGRQTRHISLLFAMVILWFFMAMRDVTVGVDTKFYTYVYSQFDDIPLWKVFTAVTYADETRTWTFDFEPGYRLMNKLLSIFFPGEQAITVFNSTIIMVLWYFLIKRDSPNFLLSVWLLLTLGIYQTQMNVTRNAIAILMVYNAFGYLRRGELPKYLGVCILASMFHMAALAFIPLYPLVRGLRMTQRRAVCLIAGFCVIGLMVPVLRPLLQLLTPARFDKYLQASNEKFSSMIVGLLNGGVFVLALLLLPRKAVRVVFSKYRLGVMMLIANLCFFGLNIGIGVASRIAALFGPYLVLLVPQMLSLIGNRTRRREATAIIAALCGVQYVLRLCINNIGGTMPYSFFW